MTHKMAFCNVDNILIGNFRHLQMIKDWVTVEVELGDWKTERKRQKFVYEI